eukprot:6840242-Ditylum_brightwellii.AAC.1
MSSVSVELLVFKRCFIDQLAINPLPRDNVMPVWPLMSGCTAYTPSTHHFTTFNVSAESVNANSWLVYETVLPATHSKLHILGPCQRGDQQQG